MFHQLISVSSEIPAEVFPGRGVTFVRHPQKPPELPGGVSGKVFDQPEPVLDTSKVPVKEGKRDFRRDRDLGQVIQDAVVEVPPGPLFLPLEGLFHLKPLLIES